MKSLKKKILLLFSCILVLILYHNWNGDPISGVSVYDVFGDKIDCDLVASHDGGIDIHGDIFTFYEYKLSGDQIEKLIKNKNFPDFPAFKFGYFYGVVVTDTFANSPERWTPFPLKNRQDSLTFQSTFAFGEISGLMDVSIYQDSSNYYACILGRKIGNCFLVLAPKKRRLYMVRHDIG